VIEAAERTRAETLLGLALRSFLSENFWEDTELPPSHAIPLAPGERRVQNVSTVGVGESRVKTSGPARKVHSRFMAREPASET